MEAEQDKFAKKSGHTQMQVEFNIEASRKRFNNLLLAFKFFIISLTLVTLALIAYLAQSESHQSPPSLQIYNYNNPIITTESDHFNISLNRAAQQLDLATSLILPSSKNEPKVPLAFNHCRQLLRTGSGHLREAIRSNPYPDSPSDRQRVEMAIRIAAAEKSINSCLDDLSVAPESSEVAEEVRTVVTEAAAYLRNRGDFLSTYRVKAWRKLWKTVDDFVLENFIVICSLGFQLSLIFFLFWKVVRSG